jgi:hypothetical protein
MPTAGRKDAHMAKETPEIHFTGDPFNPSPTMLRVLAAHINGLGNTADDEATIKAWAKALAVASGETGESGRETQ